jgi:hypothetical protein
LIEYTLDFLGTTHELIAYLVYILILG